MAEPLYVGGAAVVARIPSRRDDHHTAIDAGRESVVIDATRGLR
jgi:hypothetical protein